MPRTKKAAAALNFQPRVKVWWERDGDYAFGHGICQILVAVEQAGSIKEAAAALGKSYRHIWGRIKEAEETLGESLVATHVGGTGTQRSELTPLARQLCGRFAALRLKLIATLEREFRRLS
jgi:molybdate transport system regulatory protein